MARVPTYKLVLEYVGTRFAGWQVQPGLPTVQGELAGRLNRLFDEDLALSGAARTDAGVHAHGQVASFASEKDREPGRLRHALNRLLPEDIGVVSASIESADFHARRSARGRTYRYRIATGAYLSPFDAPFAWHFRSELDVPAMGTAAGHLVGEHDFSAFRAAGDVSATPVKTLRSCAVARDGDRIDLTVEGSSFLQHMVRTIAGTLVEVGRGHRPASWVADVLASRDRSLAGPTAPAHGLFLERVIY